MSFPRYPSYRESGIEWIGPVPTHWETVRLKLLLAEMDERAGHEQLELLGLSKRRGVVPRAQLEQGAAVSDDYSKYKVAHPGQLVMNRMQAWNGVFGLSPLLGIVSPDYAVFDVMASELSAFLCLLFQTNAMSGAFLTRSRGMGTAFLRLNTSDLLDMKVAVPPAAEARGIVNVLDRETAKIDALVAEQERLIELLKEERQAAISQAVTKGFDLTARMKLSGSDRIGTIPKHWHVRRLKQISPRLAGRLIVQPHQYFADEGVPILFGNNIGRGELHLEDLRYISVDADREFSSCRVSSGDLLTVRVGDPGATVVVPPSLDGCHFASAMWIRQAPTFDSEWLCHVMNSTVVAAQIDLVNYGAAQEQFNIGDAANFVLPVPPIDEQRALASRLKAIVGNFDVLASEAQKAIDLLRERRLTLIAAAVTGLIDLRAAAARSAA